MNRPLKRNHSFSRFFDNPKTLLWYYVIVNMAPSLYLLVTQPVNIAGKCLLILFPLGAYLFLLSLSKISGKVFIFLLPLLFLHAFQIVLFYLYGFNILASDMFLNLITTNSSEVDELMGAMIPSIVIVCLLYLPPLFLAVRQWIYAKSLSNIYQRKIFMTAVFFLIGSLVLSVFSDNTNGKKFTFKTDVYPVNVVYNVGYAFKKMGEIDHFPETSKGFSFHATSNDTTSKRKIIVLIIGETSRAADWQLYGYKRPTNPRLEKIPQLLVFKNALTQSNVTHKSVPLILSGVGARHFKPEIFRHKSIFSAFNEVGFTTICFSNQVEKSSLIYYFVREADIFKDIRLKNPQTGVRPNPYDTALVRLMKKAIQKHPGNLFIVLHSYGSHFKYSDRYPKSFGKFKPDDITSISRSQRKRLINGYDNSILFTDYFLSEAISVLKNTNAASLLLYTSDHGEDIYDDRRHRFLHASATPTYYQLRIPFLLWFSDTFKTEFPKMVAAAIKNTLKPVSTNSVFPTLIDAADIQTPYLKDSFSLVSPKFHPRQRLYLDDHDIAVPYQKSGLNPQDFKLFEEAGIKK